MAPANGIVRAARNINNSAYGRIIVIENLMTDGTTAFSFFANLGSISVSLGTQISRGQEIGRRAAGQNIHRAVVDTLWCAGGYDYFGYVPAFTGQRTTFGGITYYNPAYVLTNNCLPK